MVPSTSPLIYCYYKRCYFRLPRTREPGWELALQGLVLMRMGATLGGGKSLLPLLNPFTKSVCVAALKDPRQK